MDTPERFVDAEADFLEAARATTGFSDFGEPAFLDGLRRLLSALDRDLERGRAERAACVNLVLAPLIARLYAQEGWRRRPETLSAQLRAPVFIVGAPRTGTTALHQLLAADPGWQGLESWLVATPMVRPPRQGWTSMPEYRTAVARSRAKLAAAPELRSMHFVEPHEVDECLRVTAQTLVSNIFGTLATAPSYDAWFLAQDFRPAFRRLADNLRLIGADEPHRRWLLKNPSHLLNLEELLEVFPDAKVIHTHRDPLQSFASFWSLMGTLQKPYDGPGWRPRKSVEREARLWGEALDRSIEIQQRHPDRILDVYEPDIAARPSDVVRRVYAFVGQPFTDEAQAAVAAWVAGNPKGKHGVHRYAFEDFGTTADEIEDHVAAYRSHHGFATRAAARA